MFLGAEVPCSVLRGVEVLVELEGVFAGLLELGAGVDVGVDVERLCLGSVSWDSLFGSEFLFLLGMRNMMMSMTMQCVCVSFLHVSFIYVSLSYIYQK